MTGAIWLDNPKSVATRRVKNITSITSTTSIESDQQLHAQPEIPAMSDRESRKKSRKTDEHSRSGQE